MWPKTRTWQSNWSQNCNANLNKQVKILRALKQSCLMQIKHALRQWKHNQGLVPLKCKVRLPQSAPYWTSRLITGLLRVAEELEWAHPQDMWLHTNTTSRHSKQQNCWFLSCFLFILYLKSISPESAKLVLTPSNLVYLTSRSKQLSMLTAF